MSGRNTLIILAILALLAGYVFFFEINKTPDQLSAQRGTPTAATQPYVWQLDPSEIQKLEVRDLRDGREAILVRTDQGWQMLKPVNAPADAEKIDQAVGRLVTLQATRELTTVSDINAFGFAKAALELRVTKKDGTPYAVMIGDKTPDGSNYYVIHTGATKPVYIVGTFVIDGAKVLFDNPPLQPTAVPTPKPTDAPSESATPTPSK